jgi:diguanylate cyclase (GGDEF)-like protein
VNDTLGHAAGDAILRAIAARLKGLDGRLTIAARLGGDEFAAVTTQLASRTEAATAARLLESTLMQPVTFEGRELNVSVSVGAAVFETPSTLSIDAWLAKADMALYRAKRDGRGCSRIYDASLDTGEMSDLPDIRQLLLDMAVPARKQTDLTDRAA